MYFSRLTAGPSPADVEAALSCLCEARQPGDPGAAISAAAATQALRQVGTPAEQVTVKILVMNRVATSQLGAGKTMQQLVADCQEAGPLSPDRPYAAMSGGWRHPVVRCGQWLLDLALEEYSKPQAGFNPSPAVLEVPDSFWTGNEAIFLAGDDGSSIWMWTLPGDDSPAPDTDVVTMWADHYVKVLKP